MSTANIMMKEFISDEKERLMYEATFREECERASLLASGRRAGIKEGLAEGIAKGRAEGRQETSVMVARNMKNEGIPVAVIIKCTSLSEQDIATL